MRAMRFPRPYAAQITTVDPPALQHGSDVRIAVAACGICASDVLAYKGSHPYRVPPVITGHEIVGTVVERGRGVTALRVGDRVAVEPHVGCGECHYCRIGEYQECTTKGLIGVGSWSGGFAEQVIARESMCYPIPDGISFRDAALLEPYNVGVHAVRRATLTPDSAVAVIGVGTIGLMTLLAATKAPHTRIYATDISRPKLEIARAFGAVATCNASDDDPVAWLAEREPLGVDVAFIAVPAEAAIDQALRMVKPQGELVLIATRGTPAAIDTHQIQQFERRLIGTAMYNRVDWERSIAHLEQAPRGQFGRLVTRVVALEEAPTIIDDLAHGRRPDEVKTIIAFGAV